MTSWNGVFRITGPLPLCERPWSSCDVILMILASDMNSGTSFLFAKVSRVFLCSNSFPIRVPSAFHFSLNVENDFSKYHVSAVIKRPRTKHAGTNGEYVAGLCLGHISCCRRMVAVQFCGLCFVNVIFNNHEVLQAVVIVVTIATVTARRSHVQFMRSNTVRWPQGDRTAPARLLQLPQVLRTSTVRPPYDYHKVAVRFSTQPRQEGKNRMSPHSHLTATLRCTWLRLCGVAVSEKCLPTFNVK